MRHSFLGYRYTSVNFPSQQTGEGETAPCNCSSLCEQLPENIALHCLSNCLKILPLRSNVNLSQEILYFGQYPDKPFLMKMVITILIIFIMIITLMKIIITIIIQIIIIIDNNYNYNNNDNNNNNNNNDNNNIFLYRFCFLVVNL